MIEDVIGELKEIKNSRSIMRSLIIKNLFGRYKNSALGFIWHFIPPMMMMLVYLVAFSTIRTSPLPNYVVFLASGLFPFSFMISNLTGGSGCIIANSEMIKKIYFPRSIMVLVEIITSFIVMIIGYSITLLATLFIGHTYTFTIILLPFVLVMMALFVLGYVLIFSALTVYKRDVQYILSSVSIMFYFITPIYFIIDELSGIAKIIVMINPFTCYVEAYHQIVYYGMVPDFSVLLMCLSLPLLSLTLGIVIFHRLKRGFAERL